MYGLENSFTMELSSEINGCTGNNGGCFLMAGSDLNYFFADGDGPNGQLPNILYPKSNGNGGFLNLAGKV